MFSSSWVFGIWYGKPSNHLLVPLAKFKIMIIFYIAGEMLEPPTLKVGHVYHFPDFS